VEIGHLSTVFCHLANVGYRLGKHAQVSEIETTLKQQADAANTLQSVLDQLGTHNIDFEKQPFTAGPLLTYNNRTEQFEGDHAEAANQLVRLPDREGYRIPEHV